MDEAQGAVLHDGRPCLTVEPRGGIQRGARFEVLFSFACRERLTVPGTVTQDTEKTVVFHYSKVRYGGRAAAPSWASFGKVLQCNTIGTYFPENVDGHGCWGDAATAKNGT